MRRMADGTESPYELNSTYFSALSDSENEDMGMARFQCSQAVALSMKGILRSIFIPFVVPQMIWKDIRRPNAIEQLIARNGIRKS